MNRLKGLRAYLAGPIDNCPELGVHWRKEMSRFLWNLGCGVLNPTDKPTPHGLEDKALHEKINFLKILASNEKNIEICNSYYEEIEELMSPVISNDFAMVDRADFVIMFIDTSIHMCGTYSEETHAVQLKKPVIICCKQGKHSIPNFCFKRKGRHEMMFGDWQAVYKYLKTVDQDPIFEDKSSTWKFIDYSKVYNWRKL